MVIVVMAYIVMAYIVPREDALPRIGLAHRRYASGVNAYIVHGLYRHALYNYGLYWHALYIYGPI